MSFILLPPRWQTSRFPLFRILSEAFRVQVKKNKKRRGRRTGARQMSRSIKPTLKTISIPIYIHVYHTEWFFQPNTNDTDPFLLYFFLFTHLLAYAEPWQQYNIRILFGLATSLKISKQCYYIFIFSFNEHLTV